MSGELKKGYIMHIGERIRIRREELKMSQEELALKVGYKSRSTINKIEVGRSDVAQSKIRDYAIALDTSIGYLMGALDDKDINKIEDYTYQEFIEEIGKRILLLDNKGRYAIISHINLEYERCLKNGYIQSDENNTTGQGYSLRKDEINELLEDIKKFD